MSQFIKLEGLNSMAKALRKEVNDSKKRSKAAVLKGAMLVWQDSQKLCPVDTGNLINSSDVKTRTTPGGLPLAEVIYSASYALEVHETNKNYRKPGSSWKYLERPLYDRQKDIFQIISNELRQGL